MELPKFYIGQQVILNSETAKHIGTVASAFWEQDEWKYLLDLHNDTTKVSVSEKEITHVLKDGKWDSTADSASYTLDLYS